MSSPSTSWEPLTAPRIECKPKLVEEDKNFKVRLILTDAQLRDLVEIRNRIAKGQELPSRYYRRSRVGDRLLKSLNVMHLHLGGPGSDALLYLIQFPGHVLFLCVDSHVHLDDVPVGKKLNPLGVKAFQKRLREVHEIGRQLFGLRPSSRPDAPGSE